MTDRIKGVYVALDKDYRVDDAEAILDAIKMVKGVLDVTGDIVDFDDWNNRARIRIELSGKLWEVLHDTKEGS
ncbi:hypothetical protein LCGC14_0740120 [marine sediment metagenome]|uniref:Uncharacterized protein n=1 Tax=marine sediment metagenome TaxID=412755 RepID=A0A0F9QS15_9ZZZZ